MRTRLIFACCSLQLTLQAAAAMLTDISNERSCSAFLYEPLLVFIAASSIVVGIIIRCKSLPFDQRFAAHAALLFLYLLFGRWCSPILLNRFGHCAYYPYSHGSVQGLTNCTYRYASDAADRPMAYSDDDRTLDQLPTGTILWRRAWKNSEDPSIQRAAAVMEAFFGITQREADKILFINHVGVLINPRQLWSQPRRFLLAAVPATANITDDMTKRGSFVFHNRAAGNVIEPLEHFLDKSDTDAMLQSRQVNDNDDMIIWFQVPYLFLSPSLANSWQTPYADSIGKEELELRYYYQYKVVSLAIDHLGEADYRLTRYNCQHIAGRIASAKMSPGVAAACRMVIYGAQYFVVPAFLVFSLVLQCSQRSPVSALVIGNCGYVYGTADWRSCSLPQRSCHHLMSVDRVTLVRSLWYISLDVSLPYQWHSTNLFAQRGNDLI